MPAGAPAPDATLAAALAAIDWSRPWFAPLRALGQPLACAVAAGADLRGALDACAAPLGLCNDAGLPLHFVPQAALPDGCAYEAHIHATGAVPTRDNLHDFFNALVWLHFPTAKRLLNRLQAAAIARDGVQASRGPVRDAATLFDENAVLFLSAEPALESALRGFGWRALFVEARIAWHDRCTVLPFGHALLEKLVRPYKSVTAHAWPLDLAPAGVAHGGKSQAAPPEAPDCRAVDEAVAASLRAAVAQGQFAPRRFAPLPVLGVPGWCADNGDPAYYEDTAVFRPGRRAA
ncbi:hypothetical protein BKK79_08150 [Cupriavidus sp. USMAA2-4]|uniref:DUF3025 domain-containing protein n=1 Tax=unclassified Cupriavidus TaxID=2640874 RepID=UPI0008A6A71F|nr:MULTISPECIES: DUF3025 domain-containing protein [unclassified Cupriavidus]AOY91775.1 hypothetical protein BKK79_08150 [Cupriavidus sp. USMAA2-4]AOY98666.1 hypothetical protein BKK81_04770 [Cupriavidus sp. USMAHM13]